ncbi:restriction endonuclease subunit S [Streptomyces sp. WMMC905]|uniref:restriction endonuclease subunit S n=1 Tax=Streptomyces sp. WMMC905 TaxID=3404123 RepID=UPI003B9405F3
MSSVLGISLPGEWSSAPLKHVTTYLNRGSVPTYVDEGAVRAIGQAANQATGIDWTRTRFHDFSGDPRRLKGFLRPNDLLINSTGTGTLGRVGYFRESPDGLPCVADSHVTIARAKISELDSRFMYYWLNSRPFQEFMYAALVVGATNQIELNRDRLGDASVPLPGLKEQHRIADFLDAETARIDRLVDLRRLQLLRLEERAYAAVSEILIPGILGFSQSSGPWPWLPAMADDRPLVRLGYVCRLQNGLTVDSKRDLAGDVVTRPYLRVANVQTGHVDLDSVVEITVPRHISNRTSLRPGDVLMTEGGDLDKLGRGTVWRGELPDCLHQNHVFALRPEPDRLDGDYLALMTRTLHGRCYFESTGSRTTNLASTNSSKIMSFPIPLPSVAAQRALADEAQAVIDNSQAAKQLLERQLGLLSERRQALITAAVTGQFDVSTASGRNTTEGISA